ncbi:MAG: patatin-like phospholipase family protein, partial [Alphaproteobacteria bacterium]|nr:patatin-like phospholipase family protein [Alphaproteobacteria bacterium]
GAYDTFNFDGLLAHEPGIENFIVFDPMGINKLLQPPKDLWDAFGQSIITPLVALAQRDLKLFEQKLSPSKNLYKVEFKNYIPNDWWPTVMNWNRSNLERLFVAGYQAGQNFVANHPGLFP